MTQQDEQQPLAGGGSLGKLAIGGAISLLVLVECVVAYLCIPSAEEVAAIAEANLSQKLQLSEHAGDPLANPALEKGSVEKDLGDYSITAYQPTSNTTLRIDFQLYGAVKKEHDAEFNQLFAGAKHRFREQVIVTIRTSEINDLTDPGLGLIKRKILEKTNRLLGRPLLTSVVFSEFSFVEQ